MVKCATLIQSTFRGYRVRKCFQEVHRQNADLSRLSELGLSLESEFDDDDNSDDDMDDNTDEHFYFAHLDDIDMHGVEVDVEARIAKQKIDAQKLDEASKSAITSTYEKKYREQFAFAKKRRHARVFALRSKFRTF